MLTGTDLLAFKAISNFIQDLSTFSSKQRSLALYVRLIEKTQIIHEEAIEKHIVTFKNFCISNRSSIIERNPKFEKSTVSYSDRVFINLKHLISVVEKGDQEAIWEHLATISAIVDPAGKARTLLKNNTKNDIKKSGTENSSSENQEVNFITDMISKVEENLDPTSADPTQAIGNMMSSGVMTDLMKSMSSGMQDGSLDLGKLMGSLQGMVGQLQENPDMPPELKNMTGNLSNIIGSAQEQVSNLNQKNE